MASAKWHFIERIKSYREWLKRRRWDGKLVNNNKHILVKSCKTFALRFLCRECDQSWERMKRLEARQTVQLSHDMNWLCATTWTAEWSGKYNDDRSFSHCLLFIHRFSLFAAPFHPFSHTRVEHNMWSETSKNWRNLIVQEINGSKQSHLRRCLFVFFCSFSSYMKTNWKLLSI